jgi:hypothetical protein
LQAMRAGGVAGVGNKVNHVERARIPLGEQVLGEW